MGASTVLYRDEKGGDFHLDLSDGSLFDSKGNFVEKWSPADDEYTGLLADYATDYKDRIACSAMSKSDKDRAQEMAIRMAIASGNTSETGTLVKMDLGQGDVHIPAALPNYAAGYQNGLPMADVISPPILVAKPSDFYYTFAKEDAFQRARPTSSGSGDNVSEISPRLANTQFNTKERALGGFVGKQLSAGADAPLRIQQATVRRVVMALLIEREFRVQALLQTTGNWDASQVATIAANAQWNEGANANPLKDIQNRIEQTYGDVTGIMMSEKLWHAFVRNTVIRGYYSFKDTGKPVPTPQEVQQMFSLPPIHVAKMKYINSSGTLDYIWGNDCVLFRQPDQMPPTDQEDVATSYTFRWAGGDDGDGVRSGGFLVRQFFVQDRGSRGGMKIVVVHNDDEQMTSKFVGGLLHNAYQ